ncbi:DJ-1/PfpI family protein [Microvirga yunnanensis]|uniref:DJ-1/PfpI family protein n=1 Tax=Microvirga yunnanensis TaxID=2953740 RepID=UPI0021C98865|nr:DJ-1/PfpI family protein [Microvirga sp. HBU65207]
MHVVMLAYPCMTQLDLTGPFEVFARFEELSLHLAWKSSDPVVDGSGLGLIPTTTFADCPQADILFGPGGPGQINLMADREVLTFLQAQAENATYVTSVCTGSLVLAAAGLLTGHRATCHWLSLNQLAYFEAEPVAERVVVDRNRVTGAGVTSGIDFALTLAAALFGEDRARRVQLSMEYDPEPPFPGGSPSSSDPAVIATVREGSAAFQQQREEVAQTAAALRAQFSQCSVSSTAK